jgi:hypothetical protein
MNGILYRLPLFLVMTVPLSGEVGVVSPAAALEVPSGQVIPIDVDRLARARVNLEALLAGRLAVRDLTQQDLQDVLDYERMLRGNAVDNPTPRQKCVDDKVRRAGGRPSQLAWSVIMLKCR